MKEIQNTSELEQLIKGDKPILIDFYADWCGPCQTLLPIVDELADKYKDDVEIVKVNVDHQKELALKYNVRNIPALFFVDKGEIKDRLVGLQTKGTLDNIIQGLAAA